MVIKIWILSKLNFEGILSGYVFTPDLDGCQNWPVLLEVDLKQPLDLSLTKAC